MLLLATVATSDKLNGGTMQKSFTLAEVLITLGIVGIVAAMTLPSLVANYRNMVLENQFKKSYSILSQALIRTTQELGENLHQNYIQSEPIGFGGIVSETFYKYLHKTTKDTSIMNELGEDWVSYSGVKESSLLGLGANPAYSVLSDGSFVTVMKNNGRLNVLVDINGRKKPNRTGYDRFLFVVDTTQDKLVSWSNEKSYCDKNNMTSGYNGRGCTYFAMINQNPDDETKQYFKSLKW